MSINELLTRNGYTKYIMKFYYNNYEYVSDLRPIINESELMDFLNTIINNKSDIKSVCQLLRKRYDIERLYFFLIVSIILALLTLILLYVTF